MSVLNLNQTLSLVPKVHQSFKNIQNVAQKRVDQIINVQYGEFVEKLAGRNVLSRKVAATFVLVSLWRNLLMAGIILVLHDY